MNGISTFLEESDPNFGAPRFDEEHDGILVTELVEHEETKEIVKRHTTHIPDDSIISWLNRTEHFEHNGSQACRVFDIIWINGNIESWPWTIEIKRSNQELILDNFGLRKARQLVPPCGGFIHLPPETGTRSDLATFALYVYERVVLVWAFNKDTYRTHAICWNSNPWFPQDKMQEILEGQLHLVRHPLFLGLGAAIHMSGLNEADIGQTRDQIQAVEARTFHSPFYKDHRFGRVGSYTSLSGEMSGCVTYLACTKTELSIIREVLDFVSRNQFSGMIEQVKGPEKAMFEARKCAIVLRQRLESQEREIQYLTRRAEVQITAVSSHLQVSYAGWGSRPGEPQADLYIASCSILLPNKRLESAYR